MFRFLTFDLLKSRVFIIDCFSAVVVQLVHFSAGRWRAAAINFALKQTLRRLQNAEKIRQQ